MKPDRIKQVALFKPEIAREGIIMVLAPVLLSTALLLWVGQAWMEEGHIAYQARKDFEAGSHGAKAMTLLGKAMAGHMRRSVPQDTIRDNLALANEEVSLCKAATRESEIPQTVLPIIDRLTGLCSAEASQSKKIIFHTSTEDLATLLELASCFNHYATIIDVSQSMQEVIDAEIVKKWAIQDRALEHLEHDILFSLALIFAMALLLVARFLRSIVSRLNTLMRNTKLVGSRDVALSLVPGTDELAYLNSVLIDADRELEKTEADRKSILEMVAHDMRSPLMASQITLQLAEEFTRGKLPQRAQEQLSLAQGNLKSVLEFIEDLLGVEKAKSEFSLRGGLRSRKGNINVTAFEKRAGLSAILHPRIAHKVLAIVLLPLVIQAAMLVYIAVGILNTERLDHIGRSKSRLVSAISYGASCLFLAETRKIEYVLTRDPKYKLLEQDVLAKYNRWIEGTSKYITIPTDRASFEELNHNIVVEMKKMERDLDLISSDQTTNIVLLRQSMDTVANPLLLQQTEDDASQRSRSDEIQLGQAIEREKKQRDAVQRNIYWFIPLNLLVAVLLIIAFTRGVTSRLDLIVKHARQLPKREAIQSTVTGEDELSYLDLILQQTCANLIAAEDRRREIIQMVVSAMRSPMIAAQSSIEMINALPGDVLPAVGRKHLPSALKNIDRVLVLLNDLLTLEKLEGGKLELNLSLTPLREIADEAISALSSVAATRGISLTNQCESSSVKVDEARLNQVLINFLTNAIKFSPDNSAISLVSRKSSDSIAIGVKDQGPGMDQATAARVFEKFFQAEGKKKSEGFGLGLAICKLIVESHGGSVTVETAPGQGSTFWIGLPLLN